jgi:hypothetical protein
VWFGALLAYGLRQPGNFLASFSSIIASFFPVVASEAKQSLGNKTSSGDHQRGNRKLLPGTST